MASTYSFSVALFASKPKNYYQYNFNDVYVEFWAKRDGFDELLGSSAVVVDPNSITSDFNFETEELDNNNFIEVNVRVIKNGTYFKFSNSITGPFETQNSFRLQGLSSNFEVYLEDNLPFIELTKNSENLTFLFKDNAGNAIAGKVFTIIISSGVHEISYERLLTNQKGYISLELALDIKTVQMLGSRSDIEINIDAIENGSKYYSFTADFPTTELSEAIIEVTCDLPIFAKSTSTEVSSLMSQNLINPGTELQDFITSNELIRLYDVRKRGGISRDTGFMDSLSPAQQIEAKKLDAYAQFEMLSLDTEKTAALINENIFSIYELSKKSRTEAVTTLSGTTKFTDNEALSLWLTSKSSVSYVVNKGVEFNTLDTSKFRDDYETFSEILGEIKEKCECDECETATSPFAYLVDLIQFSVRNLIYSKYQGNGTNSPTLLNEDTPITLSLLESTFHQAFSKLQTECDELNDKICQYRIAIEVLNKYKTIAPEGEGCQSTTFFAAQKKYTRDLYFAVLGQIGTNYYALRNIQNDEDAKAKLADSLGFSDINGLFIPLDNILNATTEIQLNTILIQIENLTGFQNILRTSSQAIDAVIPEPSINTKKREYLVKEWKKQDLGNYNEYTEKYGIALDPDVVTIDDFRSFGAALPSMGNPFYSLWEKRKTFTQSIYNKIRENSNLNKIADIQYEGGVLVVNFDSSVQVPTNITPGTKVLLLQKAGTNSLNAEIVNAISVEVKEASIQAQELSLFATTDIPETNLISINNLINELHIISHNSSTVFLNNQISSIEFGNITSIKVNTVPLAPSTTNWPTSLTNYVFKLYKNNVLKHTLPRLINSSWGVNVNSNIATLKFKNTGLLPKNFDRILLFDTTATPPVSSIPFNAINSILSNSLDFESIIDLFVSTTSISHNDSNVLFYYSASTNANFPSKIFNFTNLAEFTTIINKVRNNTATESEIAQFNLSVPAILRMESLYSKYLSNPNNSLLTEDETEELLNILIQAAKNAFKNKWQNEEADTGVLLNNSYFWPTITEPKEGLKNLSIASYIPLLHPINNSIVDLPDYIAGETAINTLVDRKNYSDVLGTKFTDVLEDIDSSTKFDDLLKSVWGLNTSINLTAFLNFIYHKVTTATTATASVEASYLLEKTLFIKLVDLQEIIRIRNLYASNSSLVSIDDVLRLKRVLAEAKINIRCIANYISNEEAISFRLNPWRARKQSLLKWRADKNQRNLWLNQIKNSIRLPQIEPDFVFIQDLAKVNTYAFDRIISRKVQVEDKFDVYKVISSSTDFDNYLKDALGFGSNALAQFENLENLETQGYVLAPYLQRYNLNYAAYRQLKRYEKLLDDNISLTIEEKEEIAHILTQVYKIRILYPIWNKEEITGQNYINPNDFIQPGQVYNPDPQDFNFKLNPWRAVWKNRSNWEKKIKSRKKQLSLIPIQTKEIAEEIEGQLLLAYKNALVLSVGDVKLSWQENAKILSDQLLVDFNMTCCQKTTRLSQAISTLQELIWSEKTGIQRSLYVGNNQTIEFNLTVNPFFDEEWKWVGSYASWRAAMFVFMFPENLLSPTLRKSQSPAFRKLVEDLRSNNRLTPKAACMAAKDFNDYWEDVCNLEAKVTCVARTVIRSNECVNGNIKDVADFFYSFAQSKKSGKLYFNMLNVCSSSYEANKHSFWYPILGFEGNVIRIVGCPVYESKNGRHIYLVVVLQQEEESKLSALKYDLEKQQWENSSLDFELPEFADLEDVQFLQSKNSLNPPKALARNSKTGELFTNTLNLTGKKWISNNWELVSLGISKSDIKNILCYCEVSFGNNTLDELILISINNSNTQLRYRILGANDDCFWKEVLVKDIDYVTISNLEYLSCLALPDQPIINIHYKADGINKQKKIVLGEQNFQPESLVSSPQGAYEWGYPGHKDKLPYAYTTQIVDYGLSSRLNEIASFDQIDQWLVKNGGYGLSHLHLYISSFIGDHDLFTDGNLNNVFNFLKGIHNQNKFDFKFDLATTKETSEFSFRDILQCFQKFYSSEIAGTNFEGTYRLLCEWLIKIAMQISRKIWKKDPITTPSSIGLYPYRSIDYCNFLLTQSDSIFYTSHEEPASKELNLGNVLNSLLNFSFDSNEKVRDNPTDKYYPKKWVVKLGNRIDSNTIPSIPINNYQGNFLPNWNFNKYYMFGLVYDFSNFSLLSLFVTSRIYYKANVYFDASDYTLILYKQKLKITDGFSFNLTEEISSDELLLRKSTLTQLFNANTTSIDSPLLREFYYEAYYFAPLLIATQLSQRGHYDAALKWFKTIFDFTQEGNQRILYSFLKLDIGAGSNGFNRPQNWLLDPLNPHAIAMTRSNNYLKFTKFSLCQILSAYANAEFTKDTVESVNKAKELYEMAQRLLSESTFKQLPVSCSDKILMNLNEFICQHPEFKEYISIIELILQGIAIRELDVSEAQNHLNEVFTILGEQSESIIERLQNAETYVENIPLSNLILPNINNQLNSIENAQTVFINATSSLDEYAGFNSSTSEMFQQSSNHVWNVGYGHQNSKAVEWTRSDKSLPVSHNPNEAWMYRDSVDMSPVLNTNLGIISESYTNNPVSTYNSLSGFTLPSIPFTGLLSFCIPVNPVYQYLYLSLELNLFKIRNCMNIAGMHRDLDPYAAPTDLYTGLPQIGSNGELILSGLQNIKPTIYRYDYLVQRAKELVNNAQQVESAFLSALEKRDAEYYNQLKAKQDLAVSKAVVKLKELSVKVAEGEIDLAELQKERAEIQVQQLETMINAGLNEFELQMKEMYFVVANLQAAADTLDVIGRGISEIANINASQIAGTSISVGLPAAIAMHVTAVSLQSIASNIRVAEYFVQAGINVNSLFAQQARREQQWNYEKAMASQDIRIGTQQVKIAQDRLRVSEQDRKIAEIQQKNAEATVDFLQNKFTNADLYDWMSGILERIYSYFLQEATSIAQLGQMQLAFERQENMQNIIQQDYWELPSDNLAITTPGNNAVDRRGLTGSARLLQDLYKLDQYALLSDKRKLQLTKTFSLASYFPLEFQQFKDTGEITFETLMDYFDQDFPGHYLRLIKKVRCHVIALVPPAQGIKATLISSGISHVVPGGMIYQDTVVRRDPEMIALTGNKDSSGLFELQPQDGRVMNPFESSGVHTRWMLKMPKASNLIDYNTIADVLFTVEYTALHSFDYEQQVIKRLGTTITSDRAFSFKNEFADAWYELNHAAEFGNQSGNTLPVNINISELDFPAGLSDIMLNSAKLYVLMKPETAESLANQTNPDLSIKFGFEINPSNDKQMTNQIINLGVTGEMTFGKWYFDFNSFKLMFENKEILDIVLALNYDAETPKRV